MERFLLVGNGINIQFGGIDAYSSSATMNRVLKNIKSDKYTLLTDNALSISEQLDILKELVDVINQIKAGKNSDKADNFFMLKEIERIKRTYPENSTITSVFLEDFFLAFEIFNNAFKTQDGDVQSEFYRKTGFSWIKQLLVDGIYNDGAINEVYKNFYSGIKEYLKRFSMIFTTNYDYNLESVLEKSDVVCHLHGEFGKLAPEYDDKSLYYVNHKAECDKLISKKIPDLEHVYSNAIMSWSWLDKYGEIIEPDTKERKQLFESISGKLEIVGLSPANDEHLFFLINNNSQIKSIVYYYLNDQDIIELPHHLNKPVTYMKVKKLWDSMK